MTNKDIIYKAIKFIENNLNSEIDVMAVSQEVCYSLYHFIRLFQYTTGFTPKSYIQKRRLTESIKELQKRDKKISDIAYDYQFGSPEAFTRAFKKQFNANPSEIRKGVATTSLPIVNPLTPEYVFQSDKTKCNPPQIIELPDLLLVGTSFFAAENSYPKDLLKEWTQFTNELHKIKNKVIPERFYQVQYWSDNQELGGLHFFMGVEVEKILEVNPFFVVKKISKGKYLQFIHKGFSNKVGYTYEYIYNQYLPDTTHKLTLPFNFEIYGEKFKGPYNEHSESEIYIPIE